MPNNTRRNNNRKREAELFEKALGVAGEVGYKNTSRVAKRLSKRSGNNHLTRWRRKTNSAFVNQRRRTARQRLANLEAEINLLEEPLHELQEQMENIEQLYNPRMNPPQVTAQQEARMEVLRRNMNGISSRLSPMRIHQAYLQMLVNDPNAIQPEPVITHLERLRLNEEEERARREEAAAPRPRTLANVVREAGAPQPLTLANVLRLWGPKD